MNTIQTKYQVGDRVFKASAIWQPKRAECPDCRGEATWLVTMPNGMSFKTPCSTCSGPWDEMRGYLDAYDYRPDVEPMTIGQIRATAGCDARVEYMCEETGVGSGTIHPEASLFAERDEAMRAAEAMVIEVKTRKITEAAEEAARKQKKRIHKPKALA